MSSYRYFGARAEVGDRVYNKFGELIEFTDEMAAYLIAGNFIIVPAAAFEKEFTEQERSLYSYPSSHSQANPAFLANKKRMMILCHETRIRLHGGGPPSSSRVFPHRSTTRSPTSPLKQHPRRQALRGTAQQTPKADA